MKFVKIRSGSIFLQLGWAGKTIQAVSVVVTYCGNFTIFLWLRFYVKSILGILEVQSMPFQRYLEAPKFDFYEFLYFLKAEIYKMNKIHSPSKGKNGSFCTSRIPKIDFT